jgi:hypothetical protein
MSDSSQSTPLFSYYKDFDVDDDQAVVPRKLTVGLTVGFLALSFFLERYCFIIAAYKMNNFTYITVAAIVFLNFIVHLTLKCF